MNRPRTSPTTLYPIPASLAIILIMLLFSSGCGSTSAISTMPRPANPLVAEYTTTAPAGANVVVEFGPTTSYGRQTSAQQSVGGDVVVLVAGMKPSSTYHMRARITNTDGSIKFDPDRTFTTGALNTANFPVFRPGMFAPWGGTAQGLGNGNINLALPAPINVNGSRVFEVTPSASPQVVWEMDVSIPLTYRAERIPSLYPGVTW